MSVMSSCVKVVAFPAVVYGALARTGFAIFRGTIRFVMACLTLLIVGAILMGVGYVAFYPLFH